MPEEMVALIVILSIVALILLIVFVSCIKIIKQTEKGIVERLGQINESLGRNGCQQYLVEFFRYALLGYYVYALAVLLQ